MTRPDPFAIEITPDLILRAYRAGIFPMAEHAEDEDVFWVSPERRGILPLDRFHVSRSLGKALRRHDHVVRIDTDFDAVVTACATVGADRDSTWINATIRSVYAELFRLGHCHTVEVWDGDELIGGLYGLAIGGAFFGESMFHRRTDASKIALVHLVRRLTAGGFTLCDTQFLTEHLRSLGGMEVKREAYEKLLADALARTGDFHALDRST
jgi:leucyl/phenylalanyl-tRNA--protein transferase